MRDHQQGHVDDRDHVCGAQLSRHCGKADPDSVVIVEDEVDHSHEIEGNHEQPKEPPAKDPWGNTRIAISATTKINRKDFGLTWNAALETGGILVGDDITINLDAQFVKA